jgi:AcrR family transcriptional regulator
VERVFGGDVAGSPRTRDVVLVRAAELFADRGFAGTTVTEIGAACGISGPALYKHFPSKYALLQRLLIDISKQLAEGGQAVVDTATDPRSALRSLVEFHADFALAEPNTIRVQDRDLTTLREADQHEVRRLQRQYAELWVSMLVRARAVAEDTARLRVHATFGLLNSTPYMSARSVLRSEFVAMALRALGADPV